MPPVDDAPVLLEYDPDALVDHFDYNCTYTPLILIITLLLIPTLTPLTTTPLTITPLMVTMLAAILILMMFLYSSSFPFSVYATEKHSDFQQKGAHN